MPVKELKPIVESPVYYERIEAKIAQLLKEELYVPLMRIARIKKIEVKNSREDLISAITANTVQFVRNHFEGQFSAAVSKELKGLGATWSRRNGWWMLPSTELTPDIRQAIGAADSVRAAMVDRLTQKIGELQKSIPKQIQERLKIGTLVETAINKTNKDFEDSVRGIAIPPKFTEYQRERIRKEYTENLSMYIGDFVEKETAELRKTIQSNVSEGLRQENLVKDIQDSYGVSLNKAKFLARQETALLMTKIRQTRYEEVGVNKYRWVCVRMPHQKKGAKYKPGEVRYHHAELDGKVFTWSNPPPVNALGERKNPGQDYNCRCIARPIVEF